MKRPGAVNAHTHLYSGLAPLGMPVPSPPPARFVDILRLVWWRLDRALDEASLRASARFYAAHALLAGTTAVVDHHESPGFIEGSLDVIADACEAIGLRAVLCYGATERNGGRAEARRGLAECRRFVTGNRRPLVRGCVGLHASFTVSDETLREAGDLARELDTVVHVHVAEDAADVEDARARGYEGPLDRLLALGALPPGSILAHGVHLDDVAVRRAESAGLWLVQNPRSNENNRVGYPAALAASRRVALGTDGFPARMADEVAALRAEARAHGDDPAAAELRLDAGRALVSERFARPLDDTAVLDEDGRRALEVTVGGRAVVRGGTLVTADLEAIEAEARAEAARLFRRMESL
jgi:cytosine/adenosine deaminase-related metal-dependent hydrolase